ncbi:NTE family protein [Malonomonas rubra DSM 5091]|uniref:NTE family protein n=1 Tax=Malonomonas rubra DSM 5091 TaxID=1122189 RepID=A0A1M6G5E3_MALRU|nr:patatin-like phospholipase family protein [Malonomonas rubra]SHJ05161.1 NTE family protein [Malonomonas rubra DSM 5091]
MTKDIKKNPTVSLVLGSGGARGLAHIGIIEVLEEQGFKIESISGSSMGALVGGIYAAGELEQYRKWVTALETFDMLRLLDVSFSGSAIFKGERIINTLRDLIGSWNIEDLPISFTAVATELDRGKELWFSKGPLFNAIRASIAFPTIFSAVEHRGRKLVDGGLTNPIPIAPTLRDMTDLTIAVSLSGKRSEKPVPVQPKPEPSSLTDKYHQLVVEFIDGLQKKNNHKQEDTGFFEVISRSIDAMQNSIARFMLAAYSPDILIEIPKDCCTIYEFDRAVELIEIGRQKADEAVKNYRQRN